MCEFEGCGSPAYHPRRWCNRHYSQLNRYGVMGESHALVSAPFTVHSAGYRRLRPDAHPLADSSGYVFEHRAVLYDKIGPGVHPCHWCGRELIWREGLEVDHIDFDRANNAPANLVPSCHRCNTGRAMARRYGREMVR